MELSERAEELVQQVMGPLLLGRTVRPVRPIGAEIGLQLARVQHTADAELQAEMDHVRARRTRRLAPVDALGQPDGAEWALAAALNDLLQVTNEELSSFATRSRHATLLESTQRLCERIPPPANLSQALSRHALLGRVLDLTRTDTRVSWWTGSALFRGQAPPERLLQWPNLRRVHVDRQAVPLAEMADWAPVEPAAYQRALATLLSASPLTDLATAGRDKPPLAWSHHTLAVVASPAGQNLALRAFAHQEPSTTAWARTAEATGQRAVQRLSEAAAALPPGSSARFAAEGYAARLQEAVAAWTQSESAA